MHTQPYPGPVLPVFPMEKWQNVHAGLQLIFSSLMCSLMAFVAACIAILLRGIAERTGAKYLLK